MPSPPTFADIEAAAARIAAFIVTTPLVENAELNAAAGGRVLVKLETFQRTGSFKFRGATNRILLIPERDRPKGVVAFSSGNHAQGVAAAAAMFAMPATIVMPSDAPRAKIEGTRSHGAEIVFYDRKTGDREAIAAEICKARGATLVRPFDDAGIVAGQGTAGLEIAREAASRGIAIDEVLVPCGGGGLVSGVALAFSGTSPATKVIAVEPQEYNGMGLSLAAGAQTRARAQTPSIADALMAPMPGEIPFAVAKHYLARALVVSDDELVNGVNFAVRRLKIMAEPGGAAGLAALLAGKIACRNKTVAVVISGGNGDPETILGYCTSKPSQ